MPLLAEPTVPVPVATTALAARRTLAVTMATILIIILTVIAVLLFAILLFGRTMPTAAAAAAAAAAEVAGRSPATGSYLPTTSVVISGVSVRVVSRRLSRPAFGPAFGAPAAVLAEPTVPTVVGGFVLAATSR